MTTPPGAPQDSFAMSFIYTHLTDNTDKEFQMNELTGLDTTWKWKETKKTLVREGYHAPIHDFHMMDKNGTDVTDILFADGYKLVFVSYDLEKANSNSFEKLGKLSKEWYEQKKLPFFGLTNATWEKIETVRHENNMMMDFYTMDAIPLKMMVRSNPGLVLMNKNVIVKKWSSYNLPSMMQLEKLMNGN